MGLDGSLFRLLTWGLLLQIITQVFEIFANPFDNALNVARILPVGLLGASFSVMDLPATVF